MDWKKCDTCHEEKDRSEFNRDSTRPDGLDHSCRVCANKKVRAYYEAHKQEVLSYHHLHSKLYYQRIKQEVLSHYSRSLTCAKCGESEFRLLQLDHIDNNGGIQRKEIFGYQKAGQPFYRWLRKNNYPEGLQVLCRKCNRNKQTEHDREVKLIKTTLQVKAAVSPFNACKHGSQKGLCKHGC